MNSSGLLVLACVSISAISGCNGKNSRHSQTFFRMTTVTDVTVVLPARTDPKPLWRSIDSLLLDWEVRYCVTGKGSEVAALNRRKAQTVALRPQLAEMVSYALRYGDSLDGGFDLTILPLKEVWGFGEGSSDTVPLPSTEAVDSALAAVSYRNVTLNATHDSVRFASESARIDVGGIAKGFVLRETARLLDRREVGDYLVVAGGDVFARGRRPDGKPWLVGVQHPRVSDSLIGTVSVTDASVVTSGDYERFRIVDGIRYHHIFNSRTGVCCRANRSVTIVADDPVEADILSTGLFCRSGSEIIDYINARPRLRCLVADSSGKIFRSENWR